MRISIFLALLLATTINPAGAADRADSATAALQAEEARVLATEDEYIAAEIAADEAALRRLVDEDFRFNTSRGITTGKEELIQGILRMGMTGQSIRERSVLLAGHVALVFGTAEIRTARPGRPENTAVQRYTAVYVHRSGQWRLLALQMQPRAAP